MKLEDFDPSKVKGVQTVATEHGANTFVHTSATPNEFVTAWLRSAHEELGRILETRDRLALAHIVGGALKAYETALFYTALISAKGHQSDAHLILLEMHSGHQRRALEHVQREIERYFAGKGVDA